MWTDFEKGGYYIANVNGENTLNFEFADKECALQMILTKKDVENLIRDLSKLVMEMK